MIALALLMIFVLLVVGREVTKLINVAEERRLLDAQAELRAELRARDVRISALEALAMESGRRLVCSKCGEGGCDHAVGKRWALTGSPYRQAAVPELPPRPPADRPEPPVGPRVSPPRKPEITRVPGAGRRVLG